MIAVKICGITRQKDAQLAADLGAAALGFIFYPLSPRYVAPEQAATIAGEMGDRIRTVGVFVNATPREINAVVRKVGLDYVQLSGSESPEECLEIKAPVIKAFRVGLELDPAATAAYDVHAILLDTYNASLYGGTGDTFDWSQLDRDALHQPMILSGGLRADNILEGIEVVRPRAVDVNSGVEASPGLKDRGKLERLFSLLSETRASKDKIF